MPLLQENSCFVLQVGARRELMQRAVFQVCRNCLLHQLTMLITMLVDRQQQLFRSEGMLKILQNRLLQPHSILTVKTSSGSQLGPDSSMRGSDWTRGQQRGHLLQQWSLLIDKVPRIQQG